VPGVAEVATTGGFGKQYQVNVDPNRLQAYGISIGGVAAAVRGGNREAGGRLMEFGGTEYMVRGRGYARFIADFENIVDAAVVVVEQSHKKLEQWDRAGRVGDPRSAVVAAVKEADFIYTDLWWWVGQEDQIPERRAAFMPAYQVNMDLLRQAPAHCKFMHCLPASRGVEATDEVIDSPQSIIFDQSENRLHTEKALLVWFAYPRLKRPSAELRAFYTGGIQSFLDARL